MSDQDISSAIEEVFSELYKLTPGGSEYIGNPERCLAWVKRQIESGREAKKECARLRRQNEKMREGLEFYADGEHFTARESDWSFRVHDEGQKAQHILEEVDNG